MPISLKKNGNKIEITAVGSVLLPELEAISKSLILQGKQVSFESQTLHMFPKLETYASQLSEGIALFNTNPAEGIEFLINRKLVPNYFPEGNNKTFGNFLFQHRSLLSPKQLGDYLSTKKTTSKNEELIREGFMEQFNFQGKSFYEALGICFNSILIPKDREKRFKISEAFANEYVRQNQDFIQKIDPLLIESRKNLFQQKYNRDPNPEEVQRIQLDCAQQGAFNLAISAISLSEKSESIQSETGYVDERTLEGINEPEMLKDIYRNVVSTPLNVSVRATANQSTDYSVSFRVNPKVDLPNFQELLDIAQFQIGNKSPLKVETAGILRFLTDGFNKTSFDVVDKNDNVVLKIIQKNDGTIVFSSEDPEQLKLVAQLTGLIKNGSIANGPISISNLEITGENDLKADLQINLFNLNVGFDQTEVVQEFVDLPQSNMKTSFASSLERLTLNTDTAQLQENVKLAKTKRETKVEEVFKELNKFQKVRRELELLREENISSVRDDAKREITDYRQKEKFQENLIEFRKLVEKLPEALKELQNEDYQTILTFEQIEEINQLLLIETNHQVPNVTDQKKSNLEIIKDKIECWVADPIAVVIEATGTKEKITFASAMDEPHIEISSKLTSSSN